MPRLRLRNRINGGEFDVSVVVEPASEFQMSWLPGSNINCEVVPEGEASKLNAAAKAACLSGASYARRVFGNDQIHIKIGNVRGHCSISSPDPIDGYAIAVLWAVAAALGQDEWLKKQDSREWEALWGD